MFEKPRSSQFIRCGKLPARLREPQNALRFTVLKFLLAVSNSPTNGPRMLEYARKHDSAHKPTSVLYVLAQKRKCSARGMILVAATNCGGGMNRRVDRFYLQSISITLFPWFC